MHLLSFTYSSSQSSSSHCRTIPLFIAMQEAQFPTDLNPFTAPDVLSLRLKQLHHSLTALRSLLYSIIEWSPYNFKLF